MAKRGSGALFKFSTQISVINGATTRPRAHLADVRERDLQMLNTRKFLFLAET